MKLYEVQATEYNDGQEYAQSKLLAAENIDIAWQIARDYFSKWYEDGQQDNNNPDEFEFIDGCIRLKIESVQETSLDEWIRTQIKLHSISELPESVFETDLIKAARCAIADLEGYLEEIDIPRDDPKHPAAKTRRELLASLAEAKVVSLVYCSAADLLEACKVLTSYTTDLLYRLDDQINIGDVEEIQQAKDAIAKYSPAEIPCTKLQNACQQMLDTLDIGGEQSRQFAEEIAMLKNALNAAPAVKNELDKIERRCDCGDD